MRCLKATGTELYCSVTKFVLLFLTVHKPPKKPHEAKIYTISLELTFTKAADKLVRASLKIVIE